MAEKSKAQLDFIKDCLEKGEIVKKISPGSGPIDEKPKKVEKKKAESNKEEK